MTYFLIMGGLVASASFTLGWVLWRGTLWGLSRLSGGKSRGAARGGRRPASRRARPASSRARSPKPSQRASASRSPGRFIGWLAARRATLPLAVVASLTYLVTRLAEYGLQFRPPHEPPSGYQSILFWLGWLAAGLMVAALLQRLAAWRCR
ncbi:hypothetical protein [Halomonas faecis]|uniref:hypothetical protein n=1 Tax=Halomonas faecis TaxID=1562110 RepID=UPI0013D6BFE5|nr:hypothetical protein [Halomonas faecis]